MPKKNKRIIVIVIAAIAVLIGIGGVYAWYNPLLGSKLPDANVTFDPGLFEQFPTQQTQVDETLVDINLDVEESASTPAPVPPQSAIPQQPLCKGPESLSILVLGIDEQAQADAIRLVRVDFMKGRVFVLSIPRDFYVPIVDMEQHGITQGRINATYGYGEWFNGRGHGILSVARNIEYNFGVTFDHYIVLNFDNIADYIDQIGGIEILLDRPVADGTLYFSSGLHQMDGETAVGFMRMRYYDTDFARIRRQSMVIRAFYTKAMSELNLIGLTQLALKGLLDKNIQTDFAVKDLSPLLCLAQRVDGEDVDFVEIPSEMYRPFTTQSGGNVQVPYDTVVPFIQSVMNGSYQP